MSSCYNYYYYHYLSETCRNRSENVEQDSGLQGYAAGVNRTEGTVGARIHGWVVILLLEACCILMGKGNQKATIPYIPKLRSFLHLFTGKRWTWPCCALLLHPGSFRPPQKNKQTNKKLGPPSTYLPLPGTADPKHPQSPSVPNTSVLQPVQVLLSARSNPRTLW